jgi:hypothetical protein
VPLVHGNRGLFLCGNFWRKPWTVYLVTRECSGFVLIRIPTRETRTLKRGSPTCWPISSEASRHPALRTERPLASVKGQYRYGERTCGAAQIHRIAQKSAARHQLVVGDPKNTITLGRAGVSATSRTYSSICGLAPMTSFRAEDRKSTKTSPRQRPKRKAAASDTRAERCRAQAEPRACPRTQSSTRRGQ